MPSYKIARRGSDTEYERKIGRTGYLLWMRIHRGEVTLELLKPHHTGWQSIETWFTHDARRILQIIGRPRKFMDFVRREWENPDVRGAASEFVGDGHYQPKEAR